MKMSDAELIACKAKIVSLESSVAIYDNALYLATIRNDATGEIAGFQFSCMRSATDYILDKERQKLIAHRKAEAAEAKIERAS